MKNLFLTIIASFVLAMAISGQVPAAYPDHGQISDIHGKTKFYLKAPAKERGSLLKELLKKTDLVEVTKVEDADFVIDYQTLNNKEKPTGEGSSVTSITGQMDVYYFRDGRQIVVWSEGKTASWSRAPYLALPRKFLKELRQI